MDGESVKRATEKTRASCYAWMDEVTNAQERNDLERLHHVDHGACKRKASFFWFSETEDGTQKLTSIPSIRQKTEYDLLSSRFPRDNIKRNISV